MGVELYPRTGTSIEAEVFSLNWLDLERRTEANDVHCTVGLPHQHTATCAWKRIKK